MDKRIIINADDFGLCKGVNEAVERAHTDGVLTSATIMVNMPAATEAVEIAKRLPGFGVGVHLNLFEGRAVSEEHCVKCLLGANGQFKYSPVGLSLLSLVSYRVRNAIRTELAAQIQWAIDNGLSPTHLDSHKHIHCFPAVFSIVCELARRFKIAAVRWSFEPKQISQRPWPLSDEIGRKKAGIIRIMAKMNQLQNSYFLKTDALLGVTHTGKVDVNFFKAAALYSPVVTAEVMTHPAVAKGPDEAQAGMTQQRETELEALCSERTKQHLKDVGVKLVHYGQI